MHDLNDFFKNYPKTLYYKWEESSHELIRSGKVKLFLYGLGPQTFIMCFFFIWTMIHPGDWRMIFFYFIYFLCSLSVFLTCFIGLTHRTITSFKDGKFLFQITGPFFKKNFSISQQEIKTIEIYRFNACGLREFYTVVLLAKVNGKIEQLILDMAAFEWDAILIRNKFIKLMDLKIKRTPLRHGKFGLFFLAISVHWQINFYFPKKYYKDITVLNN